MRWLLAILIAWPMALLGANGDITGITVETNGWQALVYISGMATNGTFAYGLGANSSIVGTEKLKITVTSPGYDDTGATTTVQRIVYGTKAVRNPTPNQTYPDTTLPGDGTVKLRIALSDYVFSADTPVTADIASGLYVTNSITSAAASGLSVTNLSTATYWQSIANWTWPGNQLIRGNSMTLRAVGFHWSGRNFRPLRALKMLVTGATSGVAVSNTITQMTIDRTVPDALLTAEYAHTFDISGMTQGELLRCDFIAYPWVGDSASVIDTTANTYPWTIGYPHSITNRCDKNSAYSSTIAVVDPTGVDANGRAFTNLTAQTVPSTNYYLTIAKAAAACAGTNNSVFGHNDLEGATIYVRAGITNWVGASATYGNDPRTWVTITAYPGDTVNLTTQVTGYTLGNNGMQVIRGIGFTSGNLFGIGHFWLDQCTINTSATAFMQQDKSWYMTDCTIPQDAQGLIPSGAYPVNLIRGCDLTGFNNGNVFANVIIGNKHPTASGTNVQLLIVKSATQVNDGAIVYNNDLRGISGGSIQPITFSQATILSNGVAVVQNVFEFCSSDASAKNVLDAAGYAITNALIAHNIFVGTKANAFYNDTGTTELPKVGIHIYGNLFDDWNIKTDVFGTPSANRIGNWPVMWGVGFRNNVFAVTDGVGAAGSFPNEFCGIQTLGTGSNYSQAVTTNRVTYMQFVDRECWGLGASDPSPGGGNYRTTSIAPQLSVPGLDFLPFDLEGNYRGLSDPPGAYASAVPRKAGGFFSP